jgi:GGDEF domain-containing protein
VLWVALHDELRGPLGGDPALVSDLSERLALVCEVVREAALTPGGAPGEPFPLELAAVPPRTAPPHRAPSAPPQSPPPAATAGSPSGAALELPLWRSALADEVRQAHGGPLALLLAELEDADRVIASASPERAQFAFSEFTGALREALRRQDILASEADGRAWVIARDTSRAGAQALGRRIAQGVGDAAPFGGAPLVATVGIALLGEDGLTADELIEAAEEARFDASARGIEVSRGLTD